MVVDGFGCLQIVLGGFRWFPEICTFSRYREIPCFKFKRSRQLWEDFVVSSNNAAKVPFKQITKFSVIQKIKFHLKRPWVGKKRFFL